MKLAKSSIILLLFISTFITFVLPAVAARSYVNNNNSVMPFLELLQDLDRDGYSVCDQLVLKKQGYVGKLMNGRGRCTKVIIDPKTGEFIEPKSGLRQGISIVDAVEKVDEQKGYRSITGVKVNRNSYIIYAIVSNGKRVAIEVNAITGKLKKHRFF